MSALDPSYIRSIRDGIINGNIEANNQEALPAGLVGLYDKELFPPTMKWRERKETLYFFLVFAIAQKEISADFASAILGDEWFNLHNDDESKEEKRLQKVNDLIQLHSKRFNSAGGGKYRLYHERFRLYILQKVSEQDIAQFNDKFIELCITALEIITEKDISEKESYALEFISTHFFISSMRGETECLNKDQATALKQYAYDQQFWERQIKASKGFEWSKRMLNEMMAWASKFNEDDEVIECALNKVDLYHQEQNDAPRIVKLVADGDIETALERIEKFGGEDKEGLQRKFILYMLCLMELTLLESKEKEHAKSAIEKILNHFDENIPAFEPDLINWNDFFPSYVVFNLAFNWFEIGIDFAVVLKRSNSFSFEWILNTTLNKDIQIFVLNEASNYLIKEEEKCILFRNLALQLINQNRIEEALDFSRRINLNSWAKPYKLKLSPFKSSLLMILSNEFIKRDYDVASILYTEASESAGKINDLYFNKSRAFLDIAISLYEQKKKEEATLKLSEAIDLIYKNEQNYYSNIVLSEIAIWLSQIDNLKDALYHAHNINSKSIKSNTIICIYTQISQNGSNISILNELLTDAISYAKAQKDKHLICESLIKIIHELLKCNNITEVETLINEVYIYSNELDSIHRQDEIKHNISVIYLQLKRYDEAILTARKIESQYWKSLTLKDISKEFYKIDKKEENTIIIHEAVNLISTQKEDIQYRPKDYFDKKVKKELALKDLSLELLRQKELQYSKKCLSEISDYNLYADTIKEITNKILINKEFVESYIFIELLINRKNLNNVDFSIELESKLLGHICLILTKNNNFRESLNYNHAIISNYWKSLTLVRIWAEVVKQNRNHECDVIIRELDLCIQDFRPINASQKSKILIEATKLFFELGLIKEFQNSMMKSLKASEEAIAIKRLYFEKNSESIFSELAIEYALSSNLTMVEASILNISNRDDRKKCWKDIVELIIKYEGKDIIMNKVYQLKKEESIDSFLKAYSDSIVLTDLKYKQIIEIIKLNEISIDCLKNYLYLVILENIFSNSLSNRKLDRYNRTLNLQWAIDIKNQLPN
jgi:hypothetical protein